MRDRIRVTNARVHNLKGLSIDIPRDQVVAFTGVSGSGKSSLVFDTLHTEAQRQLIETFSSFARQRLPKLSRPDVDAIHNLATSIVIDQKPMGRTLRSTVGTATEVYTYLRMLYSRCSDEASGMASFHFSFNNPMGMCMACKGLGKKISVDLDLLLDKDLSLRAGAVIHPMYKPETWSWREMMAVGLFDVDKPLSKFSPAELELLLWADDVPITKPHGAGIYSKAWEGIARKLERIHTNRANDETPEAERGAYDRVLSYGDCEACGGLRLNPRALAVRVKGRGIGEVTQWELTELDRWLAGLDGPVAAPLVHKMRSTLGHLIDIGVGYLSLGRSVSTLSGGESQRVKMARQLDCDLMGLMYVLDEPSVGLHPRDIDQLIGMLRRLRDRGNSVLVVEHDPAVIAAADHVIEIGPGAGRDGGQITFAGAQADFQASDCLTARWLNQGAGATAGREGRRPWSASWAVRGARVHNLTGFDVEIPQGVLVCITGVAGSGKSTLVHEVFAKQHSEAIVVDQVPVGRSSRSIPATYLGIFDHVRRIYAEATGQPAAMFSFNSKGACPTCKGAGTVAVEMNFLDDVRTVCTDCHGRRYTEEVLELEWRGRSIDQLLAMTAREAVELFDEQRQVSSALQVLCEVGLGYLTLGQPLSTLSGGECQRLKLASELGKSGGIYILDEPTTGLHPSDISRLMSMLCRLVDDGNSVIVIEHNLQVIAQADWIIDLGPEGGSGGGRLMAEGTPEEVARCAASHTGRCLSAYFSEVEAAAAAEKDCPQPPAEIG